MWLSAVVSFDSLAHIQAHHLNEVAKFVNDRRFRNELPSQVVEDVSRRFRHILERQAETFRVPKHGLVWIVDELAAALGDLAWKEISQ